MYLTLFFLHCPQLFLLFFFLMIRRPPRSTLFPTRRSSDLTLASTNLPNPPTPNSFGRPLRAGSLGATTSPSGPPTTAKTPSSTNSPSKPAPPAVPLLPLLLWRRGPGRGGRHPNPLKSPTQATAPSATTCFPSSCPPASAPASTATAAPPSPKIVPENPNTTPASRIQYPHRPLPTRPPTPDPRHPPPLPGTSTSASPCPTP